MTSPANADEADGLPVPERYRAAAVVLLGIVLTALDGSVVNLALPAIARDLNSSAAGSVWVVNAFQLAALSMLLPLAALGERIGYRRVYLGGLALFTLASLLCLFARSLPMLAAARGMQGLGAAGVMAVNGALLRLIYPRHQFGRGIAINSAVVAASTVAGPSVAAAVLSVASWPWLFVPNLPLGLLVLVIGRAALPYNRPGVRLASGVQPRDVLLNVLMFSLVFLGAQTLGQRAGAGPGISTTGVLLLGAGVCAGWIYLRRQWRLPRPLFPIDLLRLPVFALSICTSVASFAAQTLAFVALPFLLIEDWGRSPAQAGLLLTAWPAAVVLVAPMAGRMIGRYPGGLLGGIGLFLLACGLALLALLDADALVLDIGWRMALCGVGFALFQSPNNHTILTSGPLDRAGAAGAMVGSARLTGQTLGAVIVGLIFAVAGAEHGRGPVLALGLAAGFAGAAALFSLVRLRYPPPAR